MSTLSIWYLGSGTVILQAIKKYGKHNFKKEILKDNIQTQRQLDIWEQIYIKKFDSINPSIGYNIMPGTVNGFGYVNPMKIYGISKKATAWQEKCRKENLIVKRPNRKFSYKKKLEIGNQMRVVNMGRIHITNGIEDKFIVKTNFLPTGWRFGRTYNHLNPKIKRERYVK
jgi:hypothetical protein